MAPQRSLNAKRFNGENKWLSKMNNSSSSENTSVSKMPLTMQSAMTQSTQANENALQDALNAVPKEEPIALDMHTYLRQYELDSVRCQVLQKNIAETIERHKIVDRDLQSTSIFVEHLENEEKRVRQHIEELQTELVLVQQQLEGKRQHESTLQLESQHAIASLATMQAALEPLETSRDKAYLLLQRLAPHLLRDDC